eukprot:Nitzschia sp. Nitz4//scaffold448_size7865//726//2399//NITZ4_009143-RA/size7865-processed-gene-0.4-mRNA-1//-1//CDS//3329552065//350//frame0
MVNVSKKRQNCHSSLFRSYSNRSYLAFVVGLVTLTVFGVVMVLIARPAATGFLGMSSNRGAETTLGSYGLTGIQASPEHQDAVETVSSGEAGNAASKQEMISRERSSSPAAVDVSNLKKQSLQYANVTTPEGVDSSVIPQITLIEFVRQRMSFGSGALMPHGSPWCHGNATFWMVGHQLNETPWCFDSERQTWSERFIAVLGTMEPRDPVRPNIDRHGCAALDVDEDGLPDLICSTGSNYGTAIGYPELYLTQANGSLTKVLQHGLEKYITLRGRFLAAVKNEADEGNIQHVIHVVDSRPRDDGAFNSHALYRVQKDFPYFQEVYFPKEGHGIPSHIKVVDWNQDGREDFIIFQDGNHWALFFEQQEGGRFKNIEIPQNANTKNWFTGDVADVNGDGILDLVVAKFKWGPMSSKLQVHLGIDDAPWKFDSMPYYSFELPYKTADLVIFDANQDGIPDVYVVQTNFSKGQYCGDEIVGLWKIEKAPTFVAPRETAHDVVFLGKGYNDQMELRFLPVEMPYEISGCGHLVAQFGDSKTLALTNSNGGHLGASAILSWGN